MPRNIVICCDGTANEFAQDRTNVVKLYYTLEQDPSRQIAFYHPGLGTMEPAGALMPATRKITRLLGMAVGLWAKNFEQLTVLNIFFITPLSFVGGVFNTVSMLPPWLKWLAQATPKQRANWSLEPGGYAIYWPDLDDGIEVCHLLDTQPIA